MPPTKFTWEDLAGTVAGDILEDYLKGDSEQWIDPARYIAIVHGWSHDAYNKAMREEFDWRSIQAEGTGRDWEIYWNEKMARQKDGIK